MADDSPHVSIRRRKIVKIERLGRGEGAPLVLTPDEVAFEEKLLTAYGDDWMERHRGLLDAQLRYIRSL